MSKQPQPTLQEQFDAALAELSPQQRVFVEEYLTCLNASEAARRAKYKTKANVQGARMLANDSIATAVQLGFQLHTMPSFEVLARIAEHARGTMADFLRIDDEEITLSWSLLSVPTTEDGEIDIASAMLRLASQENVRPTDRILHTATIRRPAARLDLQEAGRRGKLGLVKKYSFDDKGKVSIELYDAQAALQLIGRHHKLFVDRTEITGEDGAPLFPDFEQALSKGYADDDPPTD